MPCQGKRKEGNSGRFRLYRRRATLNKKKHKTDNLEIRHENDEKTLSKTFFPSGDERSCGRRVTGRRESRPMKKKDVSQ